MMNLWCTSESASDVSQLYFSNTERIGAINGLVAAINRHLKDVDSGEWQDWRVIFMIVTNDHIHHLKFHETRRLTRRDMTLDFRVFVDYAASRNADFNKCIDLLIPALERTLPYFSKAKIGKDVQEKIRKIIHLAAEEAKSTASIKH